jgi:site-specific DNA recombinase
VHGFCNIYRIFHAFYFDKYVPESLILLGFCFVQQALIKGSSKYQKRYPFSGKIKCAECGSSFKRRIHGSGNRKYIAWCCTKHIKDASSCSMKFVREDAIHQAFVVMINKLIFGHKFILRPLLQSLKKTNYSDNITKIQEMETKIKENTERVQVIMGLMAKGYLEPALFNLDPVSNSRFFI